MAAASNQPKARGNTKSGQQPPELEPIAGQGRRVRCPAKALTQSLGDIYKFLLSGCPVFPQDLPLFIPKPPPPPPPLPLAS